MINEAYNFPRIEIDLQKIEENVRKIVELCDYHGIRIAAVTKLVCGHPELAAILANSGIEMLADARIENIKRYVSLDTPKMMLRLPMASQVDQVIELCDVSLVSDFEMMRLLSESALKRQTVHKVIIMIDLGDLREGIYYEKDIQVTVDQARELPGIQLIGIGTNLSCYGGVMPTQEALEKLVALKERLNTAYDLDMKVVSGGNSGTLSLLINEGTLPKGINHLRLGASVLMGIGLNDEPINSLKQNTFRLVCEVIEVKKKPSVPVGEIGLDAFGNKPVFEDKGEITRCICAIGKQDICPSDLIPCDKGIEILGASSDHLILDVTQCEMNYHIGDAIAFDLTYGGCLSLMTSEYVQKYILPIDD